MNRRHKAKYRRTNARKRPLPTPRESRREMRRLIRRLLRSSETNAAKHWNAMQSFAKSNPHADAEYDRWVAKFSDE